MPTSELFKAIVNGDKKRDVRKPREEKLFKDVQGILKEDIPKKEKQQTLVQRYRMEKEDDFMLFANLVHNAYIENKNKRQA